MESVLIKPSHGVRGWECALGCLKSSSSTNQLCSLNKMHDHPKARGGATGTELLALYIQLLRGALTPFTPESYTHTGAVHPAARSLDSTTRTTFSSSFSLDYLHVSLFLDERKQKKLCRYLFNFPLKTKEQHLSALG